MLKLKLKGFTLAEVLITLGIIGVVAAMTLPALINRTQGKELEAEFKKAYSVLQAAYNQMTYDEGQIVNQTNYPGLIFINKFKKYFKLSEHTLKNYNGSNKDEETGQITYISKVYKTYNNKPANMSWFDDGQTFLCDGMTIFIENMINGNIFLITVDINGFQKKPNRFGHDVFSFEITNKGKILPFGAPGTFGYSDKYCKTTATDSRNGLGCTYKALTDKDYFKNLPK